MAKIQEYDRIILTENLEKYNLLVGDIGIVVDIKQGGKAFAVEFMTADGETVAVVTLPADQVRAAEKNDMPHSRQRAV